MSRTLAKPRSKKAAEPGSGVVSYYVHEAPKEMAFRDFATPYLVKELETGLPVAELTDLQASLGLPAERLAPMLGISKATFHRRKGTAERLESSVSDRVVRFARLLGKAIQQFGEGFDKVLFDGGEFGLGGAVGSEEEQDFLGIPGLLDAEQVSALLRQFCPAIREVALGEFFEPAVDGCERRKILVRYRHDRAGQLL